MKRFELLGRNGAGANSTVFRCRDNASGELVAVKKIEGATLPQILQEAAIMRVCAHKHCVSLLEAHQGLASGVVYLIMEYVEHSLSRELLLNPRGLSLPRAKEIAFQLATALEIVHSKKVIHGDLKPANVLLTGQNGVKLCDFGSATSTFLSHRFAEADAADEARSAGSISPATSAFAGPAQSTTKVTAAASRWYCAPESLLGSASSAASDIWALGCIIGELITGKPLMPGGENELDQLCCIMAMVGRLSEAQEQLLRLLPREQRVKLDAARARGPLLDRIPKVAACPTLADVMKACLQPDPTCRPTAEMLQAMPFFEDLLQAKIASKESVAEAAYGAPGTVFVNEAVANEDMLIGPAISGNACRVSDGCGSRRTSSERMEVDSVAVGSGLMLDGTATCSPPVASEAQQGAQADTARASADTVAAGAPRPSGVQAAAPMRPVPRARVSALTATIRGNPFEGDGGYIDLMPQVLHLAAKWDEAHDREVLGPIAMAARRGSSTSPMELALYAPGYELPLLLPHPSGGAIAATSVAAIPTAATILPDQIPTGPACTTPIAAAAGGCGAVLSSTVAKLFLAAAAPMDCSPATPAETAGHCASEIARKLSLTLSTSVGAVPYLVKLSEMEPCSPPSGFCSGDIAAAAAAAASKATAPQMRSRAVINRSRRHHSRERCNVPTGFSVSSIPHSSLGSSATLVQRELAAACTIARPANMHRAAGHAARRSFADLSDLASVTECETLCCETPPEVKRRRGLLSRQSLLAGHLSQASADSMGSLATEASTSSLQHREPMLFGRTTIMPSGAQRLRRSSSGTGLVTNSPSQHGSGWRHLLPAGVHRVSQPRPIVAHSGGDAGGGAAVLKARGLASRVFGDIQNSAASDVSLGSLL
ncbi:hypothetical protein Vafri_10716 [Volvox africanus]|uniref:Protein kinase domain-containing protein n=1 Tax=Volvox africanus TaxID=51714 RepID=A0A8J4F0Z5_9CHLO|nr:hypothetical protein Vafri_10716 [Volvox africanus]